MLKITYSRYANTHLRIAKPDRFASIAVILDLVFFSSSSCCCCCSYSSAAPMVVQ
jgi:hypothetical protein